MKRKIPLMLVLGIVGVLVVSFIIGSRASASLVHYDVEVDGQVIGYVEMPDINYLLAGIVDDWSSDDILWEYIIEEEDLMDYTGALTAAVDGDDDMQNALGILDDIPGYIYYKYGFDETDLVPDQARWDVTCSIDENQTSCEASYVVTTDENGAEIVLFLNWTQAYTGYGMRYDLGNGNISWYDSW